MTTVQARNYNNPKPVATGRATKAAVPKTPAKAQSKPSIASKTDGARREAHLSKHDRVLALLSKPDGATIEDMMDATGWQQHSVRGFLAGTVKRKLGLALLSSKTDGEARRYRIATRRGR